VVARGVNFVAGSPPPTPRRIEARVRHRQAPAPATLQVRDATTVEVEFEVAQRAVAPGQSVVFYEGDVVLGGGVIAA
jgi:tRNA-specific 2-thiouridylase